MEILVVCKYIYTIRISTIDKMLKELLVYTLDHERNEE